MLISALNLPTTFHFTQSKSFAMAYKAQQIMAPTVLNCYLPLVNCPLAILVPRLSLIMPSTFLFRVFVVFSTWTFLPQILWLHLSLIFFMSLLKYYLIRGLLLNILYRIHLPSLFILLTLVYFPTWTHTHTRTHTDMDIHIPIIDNIYLYLFVYSLLLLSTM